MDGLRNSPNDPYYRLGPVHTCLYVHVRETGDWDLFLGLLEWAMGVIAKGIPRGCQGE